jgi:HJR/Mrr/RecB family endonuclease
LTCQSRDGGVDIYLFERDSKEQAIVECKRYRNNVGITLVDRLLGVQLALGYETAYLVTTSKFTTPAINRAHSTNILKSGFELKLIDASKLISLLGVYNEELPPLYLDKRLRRNKL